MTDLRTLAAFAANDVRVETPEEIADAELAAVLPAHRRRTLDEAAGRVRRLNGPMVEKLRRCAADTSPNWDRAVTVYPPEASGLVALIDYLAETGPAAPLDATQPAREDTAVPQETAEAPGDAERAPVPEQVYLDAALAHLRAVGDHTSDWYVATQASMPGHRAAVESAHTAGIRSAECDHDLEAFDRLADTVRRVRDLAEQWIRQAEPDEFSAFIAGRAIRDALDDGALTDASGEQP